ncbi:hypothetical protein D3C83_25820 [compost metagenome]
MVRHDEHGLEAAQDTIGAPVLRQFHRRAHQVALVLLELAFEALEERECIGRAAGKTRKDPVVIETPHLAGTRFHHDVAQRHLAVAAERNAAPAPYRQYGGAVKSFVCHGKDGENAVR